MFILVRALHLFSFVFLDLDESSNLDTTKTKTNLENCKSVGKNVIQCCRNKNYWEYVLKALFLSYHDFLQTCIVQCYGILQCIQNNVASITRKYMVSFFLFFFTPPRFRWGVIFSLQFVCVCVCLCVCECVSDSVCEPISVERMHRFGRGFH